MPQETFAVIRRAIDHLNRTGDFASDCFDPEVEWTTRPDGPTHDTFHGLEGLRRGLQVLREAWGSGIRLEIQELVGTPDSFVMVMSAHLRGHGSGVELEVEEGWAMRMRNGRIWRAEQYGSKQEALQAAGLSPEAG
jgi:ketosteroid isomerase-like protein